MLVVDEHGVEEERPVGHHDQLAHPVFADRGAARPGRRLRISGACRLRRPARGSSASSISTFAGSTSANQDSSPESVRTLRGAVSMADREPLALDRLGHILAEALKRQPGIRQAAADQLLLIGRAQRKNLFPVPRGGVEIAAHVDQRAAGGLARATAPATCGPSSRAAGNRRETTRCSRPSGTTAATAPTSTPPCARPPRTSSPARPCR